MVVDFRRFSKACKPRSTTSIPEIAEDLPYYINCSSVRESDIVAELVRTITFLSPDEPTCQLLTGHDGCGKSIELLRLKAELENSGFHVIYFQSSQDLDFTKVIVSDILLAIAIRVITSLQKIQITVRPESLVKLLAEISQLLPRSINISESYVFTEEFNAEIIKNIKNNPEFRKRRRDYLELETNRVVKHINEEIFNIANEKLKLLKKKGLVVIVDNLDRLDIKDINDWVNSFIDPDERLRKLQCHVIYTIPLALIVLNHSAKLHRLGTPKVLSTVPVQLRSGGIYDKGIALMRYMVLKRAFPDIIFSSIDNQQQLDLITKVFDSPETLDRLCLMSAGHISELLGLLYSCLQQQEQLPIIRNTLDIVIRKRRDRLTGEMTKDDWEFLEKLIKEQNVRKEEEKSDLLQSMQRRFIFEYFDEDGRWFMLNPFLAKVQEDNQMKDFFISYSTVDRKWATWIAWVLEEANYSVVLDVWDFRSGENFALKMQEAAVKTKKTIAILSQNYLEGLYTKSEWAAAFADDPQGENRKLIPIRIEKCELVGLHKPIIYVDIVGLPEQDACSAILGAFSERGKPSQAPPFPGTISSERVAPDKVQYPGNSTEESVTGSIRVNHSIKKVWNQQERLDLMRKLNALSIQQFNMLVFVLNPPSAEVPSMPANQNERTFALLTWAERPGACGLTQVEQVFNSITIS
ncbi:toll/interleukin-1 receptor domain-containing protein [Nostoc sp. CALU 1950]|uniref:toll/interleukin-1 receptor domain-containing protein n=1 Tax=Nostoc sp. CALU 1950 TaxID=3104321 RepID=UPI003EBB099B